VAENGTAFAATEQGAEKSIVFIENIRFLIPMNRDSPRKWSRWENNKNWFLEQTQTFVEYPNLQKRRFLAAKSESLSPIF